MAKVKQPLFSLGARRKLGDDIVFKRQGRTAIVETRPRPIDARSTGQLSWRHMFLKVVALWHALNAAEKEAWESLARPRHMTGYAWFVSQALRPNPGIYLPLQGGTMSGDIDMAKHRLLRLPLPVDGQEPVNLTYYNDNLPVGGYTKGARAYHNANQSIPNATWTTLTFNSERWDTDTMHGVDVPLTRLKCNTAGKYLVIANINFAVHATGVRGVFIHLGGTQWWGGVLVQAASNTGTNLVCSTILDLAIGNFIEVQVFQNRGGALNLQAQNYYSPEFMAQRIG